MRTNTLNVISMLPEFRNRQLKKYNINGVEYVGAHGNEPFCVDYYNDSGNKVQVKVALDGTDVLTAKEADLELNKNMWVVAPYGHLRLKAWAENSNGGAEFVFTDASNSVAGHTHGNTSNKGIISVAVFTEGYQYSNYKDYNLVYKISNRSYNPTRRSTLSYNTKSIDGLESTDGLEYVECRVKSTASVGAGQHVEQQISYTQGLIQPQFSHIQVVRYVWWSELVEMLEENNKIRINQPTGFIGYNQNYKMANLGSTPRVNTPTKPEDKYNRFEV